MPHTLQFSPWWRGGPGPRPGCAVAAAECRGCSRSAAAASKAVLVTWPTRKYDSPGNQSVCGMENLDASHPKLLPPIHIVLPDYHLSKKSEFIRRIQVL